MSQVNALLGDVLKHVKPDKAYEALQPQLQSMVLKILAKYFNFGTIFGMVRLASSGEFLTHHQLNRQVFYPYWICSTGRHRWK